MFIDTHGHVSFQAFKDDADAVLKRALQNNIWVVMPGTQYETSRRAVEIAERYGGDPPASLREPATTSLRDVGGRSVAGGVYAAIGLHPIHLGEKRHVDELELQSELPAPHRGSSEARFSGAGFETKAEEFEYEKYKTLGQSKKVVAIGECGLDYYYEPKNKEKRQAQRLKQKTALALQLKLAGELHLPIILHCRKAHEDLLEFLKSYKLQAKKLNGVVHCYTGDLKQAEQFYNLGLYFGFNGLIFKDVPALPNPEEIIASIPLDRIVLETDSPYLTPPQTRGVSDTPRDAFTRNEPLFVRYVAEEIARIKRISVEEVASATTQNAKTLFGLIT
ncbi:MAG: TatD family hydrolase [Candidatus Wildermuthbacteria bacterium]|nr:TatD family hydrolase [Candidatus Wildermuthbacteria bacterium]